MTEEDDIDGLAAEYVLGSLDPAERRHVDARRKTDTSLDAAVAAWERRLGPLSDRTPGLAPPAHLFDDVLSRISEQAVQTGRSAEIIKPRRWRVLAVSASALAACVALAIGWFIYAQSHTRTTQVGRMDCSKLYKDFWENLDRERYVKIPAEQLAGLSRMALRAYDACQAGDEQDAKALFHRLERTN